MRLLQISLLTALAVFGFTSITHAADMAVKAPPMAPAPAFDWSGFYIGGDLGWQGSQMGLSSPPATGASLTYAPTHDSFAGGGFAGVQKQFGQFVLGIEGGYLAATGNGRLGATPAISIFFPGGTGTAQASLRDVWNIGGRVGVAMSQWMPYLTGGYANGTFQFTAQNVAPSAAATEVANSNNGGGYIGGGVDYAVTKNWIVGAEYRHYFFGSQTVASAVAGIGGFPFEPVTFAPRTDTVLARVSYKFDLSMH
jgi:outer membrane immunogenic protein